MTIWCERPGGHCAYPGCDCEDDSDPFDSDPFDDDDDTTNGSRTMYAMNLNAYQINLDAPITAPLRSPQYVADEIIDRINHDLTVLESALQAGAKIGEQQNTLLTFVLKIERLLASH